VKRHLLALAGATGVLLAAGPGVAAAQSVQGVQQVAGTGQSATSNANSTQVNPSNSNISVRIFSPGEAGTVSQENTSAAGAAAGNAAATTQAAAQSQAGGAGEQAVGQEAATVQDAAADAQSKQIAPSNDNISVRIHSEGDDGDVQQSNDSAAEALAGNKAETKQDAAQKQGGSKCCDGGDGVQAVGQEAHTGQKADADAKSQQIHPSNSNIAVRIGSPGDAGKVTQSNSSAAKAKAGNIAGTSQRVAQDQAGRCGCSADLVQAVGQKAITGQHADADASSYQKGASNKNAPLRIHSEGDDGDVHQSNDSAALSAALNAAKTTQSVDQRQSAGCGCEPKDKKDRKGYGSTSGAGVQAVGQWAETWQKADSDATSVQYKPSNHNGPVRIKSAGGGGDVSQSNSSFAGALSLNLALTQQAVKQSQ
jgi:GTP cyclohydrolase II